MSRRLLVLALIVLAVLSIRPASLMTHAQEAAAKKRKVTKTDEEWFKLLTPDQFAVTRRKATEPAFSGKYATSHGKGTYTCICCNAFLFSSQAKFDSGTGWPSFWRPIDPKRLETAPDNHSGEPRVEVMCTDCGAHLGHVFDDGPPPTGLRFCINSLSLKLIPATAPTASKKTSKTAGKSKTKGKTKSPAPPDPGPIPDEPAETKPATPETKPAAGK
jgi:peptide-methionine (R)-S-oxide reductase